MVSIRLLPRRHLPSFQQQQQQPVSSLLRCSQIYPLSTLSARQNAASPQSSNTPSIRSKPHRIDPRWLTLTKRRIGKCLMFGLKPAQVQEAGRILQQLARDWRELIAGSEGFLTGTTRRALFRHNVVWGEMVRLWFPLVERFRAAIERYADMVVPAAWTGCHGHVNNVTYVRYAETGRVNLMRNYGTYIDPAHKQEWLDMVGSKSIGLIVRSIKVDYKFPMTWPDKITVYHKLTRDPSSSLSQSSFEQEVLILSEARQRPAARCLEENVIYDYRIQRKAPTPPVFILDQFRKTWELQEESKRIWQQRIAEIEDGVRTLELESWDREDAVEDMGSAAGR